MDTRSKNLLSSSRLQQAHLSKIGNDKLHLYLLAQICFLLSRGMAPAPPMHSQQSVIIKQPLRQDGSRHCVHVNYTKEIHRYPEKYCRMLPL